MAVLPPRGLRHGRSFRTIRVLAARIDRLAAEEKRLLEAAAVIGKDVPFAVLQAIAEVPEDVLRDSLATLQAGEFLHEARLFPDLEYTFKHALTHEVAYGSLLQDRRRALHARIVTAIERLHPDRLSEQADRLAHHAVLGEAWETAVTYLRQAAIKAAARSAYREAAVCLEQALGALAHLPESPGLIALAIDLRLEAWGSLSPLGQYARLLDHLRTAETLAIELGDQGRLAWVLAQLCQSLRMRRDIDGAIETGQRALAIASAIEDLDLQAAARYHLAEAYDSINDYRRARDLLNWIVDALNRGVVLQDPGPHEAGWLRLRARTSLTMTLSLLGHFTEGALHGEQAVRIADAEDRPFSRIVAQTSLGYLYLNKGDLHRAIPLLEESLALHRTRHISGWLRGTAATLGFAYTLSGRTAEGLPLLEEALAVDIAEGGSPDPVRVRQLGHAYLLIGRLDEALERAQYALTLSREQKRPGEAAWALHLLGEIAVRREHPHIETAEAHYQQALALATELGMRPLVAHCHLGLGKLYCRTGDRAKAEEHLTTATTMYREMDMRFWLAQAEAELRPLG